MMEALVCMALNVYFEARNQPLAGQIAVAQVVMNRTQDSRYPNEICEVVKQGPIYANGAPKRDQCQFSWYCDGKSDRPKDQDAYRWSVRVAGLVLAGKVPDITEGATHYHAVTVSPEWSRKFKKLVTIDDHVFYK